MATYKGFIFLRGGVDDNKGSYIVLGPLLSNCSYAEDQKTYYEGEEDKFLKDFPFFSKASWSFNKDGNYATVDLTLREDANLSEVFIFTPGFRFVSINGKTFAIGGVVPGGTSDKDKVQPALQVERITNSAGVINLCSQLVLFPTGDLVGSSSVKSSAGASASSGSVTLSVDVLKKALKEVLEDENSDLIRVVKDCPYIPIRSLDGKDGSVYKDGEFLHLDKLDRTFKVLGSFHIVRDTDLNLATCYALGIDKEPSLIVPEVVLKQLKGGS